MLQLAVGEAAEGLADEFVHANSDLGYDPAVDENLLLWSFQLGCWCVIGPGLSHYGLALRRLQTDGNAGRPCLHFVIN